MFESITVVYQQGEKAQARTPLAFPSVLWSPVWLCAFHTAIAGVCPSAFGSCSGGEEACPSPTGGKLSGGALSQAAHALLTKALIK